MEEQPTGSQGEPFSEEEPRGSKVRSSVTDTGVACAAGPAAVRAVSRAVTERQALESEGTL